MRATLTVKQADPITSGWPACCQDAYQSFEENSETQKRASKWIALSLFPWYRPCETCANDITRRYFDKKREWIGSRIRWEAFDIDDQWLALTDLNLFDLLTVGATAGAQDFMTVMMEHDVNGQILTDCINGGALATGRDIIYDEWVRVVDVLKEMKVSLDCITDQRYENNQFINTELEGRSKEKGRRMQHGAGVFGRFGGKYGSMGADCGGWEEECAEIGRKAGGKNNQWNMEITIKTN